MSKYAKAHAEANGAGDARPTALQIIKGAEMEGKLEGKVAVITGSSSGIGIETVRALAATGLSFILPVRDQEKAKAALGESFNPEKMALVTIDQSSLESVRDAANAILSKTDKINILITNAGLLTIAGFQQSKDGHELHFATNYLSHFLLFQLLKPALLAGSTPEFQSRVVAVSSDAHQRYAINETGNYSFEQGGYNPFFGYSQSKTALVYMANEIERRYGSRGIHATSLHPGLIHTQLAREFTPEQAQAILHDPRQTNYWKSLEQGAATTVWAAVGREWEGKGGKYLSDCAESPLGTGNPDDDLGGACHTHHTYNEQNEARLWKDSLAIVNVPDDE